MNKLAIILITIALLTSCAREVTTKNIAVRELELTVTFKAPPIADNKYYFIFSPSDNIEIIGNDYVLGEYFLAPGEAISDEQLLRDAYYGGDVSANIQDVYDDFISSWSELLIFEKTIQKFSYTAGPFVSANEHLGEYVPHEVALNETTTGTQLYFKINLDSLTATNILYFNILSVASNQNLVDYIEGDNCSIILSNGQQKNEADPTDTETPPDLSLDIESWQAKVTIKN